MLQQTRVDTVIDYWHRFLTALPTLQDLAQASEEEVMKLWQGLGYYRRARYLHQAAKQLTEQHGGQWPRTQKELIQLAGFGAYTSGAVASIAFGEQTPCVDGNVKRVLSRIFATHHPVDDAAWQLAQCVDPGSLNQALMELGATLCSPTSPQCLLCPVQKHCQAQQAGTVAQFPAPKKKKAPKQIWAASLALQNQDGLYLFEKRTQPGRWEGLWQFPFYEWTTKPHPSAPQDALAQAHPHAQNIEQKTTLQHILTHQKIHVTLWQATTAKPIYTQPHHQWLPLTQTQKPISKLQRKLIALVQ
jgi:A/G-specific adenine glycosylase